MRPRLLIPTLTLFTGGIYGTFNEKQREAAWGPKWMYLTSSTAILGLNIIGLMNTMPSFTALCVAASLVNGTVFVLGKQVGKILLISRTKLE